MKLISMSLFAAVLTALGFPTPTHAAEATEINQLKEQIEQLDQKLKVLEREA
jgi:hypothetical protein